MTQFPAFNVRSGRPAADVLTLAVEGELDLASIDTFAQRVETEVGTDPPGVVVLDLAACEFMDSSGMGQLLRQHAALRDRGVVLVIAACGRAVRRSLELTGIDKELTLADDVPAAIALVRAPLET